MFEDDDLDDLDTDFGPRPAAPISPPPRDLQVNNNVTSRLLTTGRGSNSKNRSPLRTLAEFSATSHVREVFFSYLQDLRSTEFFAPSYETWVEMSPGNCTLCLAGG